MSFSGFSEAYNEVFSREVEKFKDTVSGNEYYCINFVTTCNLTGKLFDKLFYGSVNSKSDHAPL